MGIDGTISLAAAARVMYGLSYGHEDMPSEWYWYAIDFTRDYYKEHSKYYLRG